VCKNSGAAEWSKHLLAAISNRPANQSNQNCRLVWLILCFADKFSLELNLPTPRDDVVRRKQYWLFELAWYDTRASCETHVHTNALLFWSLVTLLCSRYWFSLISVTSVLDKFSSFLVCISHELRTLVWTFGKPNSNCCDLHIVQLSKTPLN
jgi:hypothetical protein